jgi:hypothetical protein
MKIFSLIVAMFFLFALGRPASADTLFDFTVTGSLFGATGTLTTNGDPSLGGSGGIIGFTIVGGGILAVNGGFILNGLSNSLEGWDVTFTTSTESFEVFKSQDFSELAFNLSGVQIGEGLGGLSVTRVSPTPLPGSAPLFALALMALAAFGYFRSRTRHTVPQT